MENIRTASETAVGSFGPAEQAVIAKAVAAINAKVKVGCTGCGYCQPCPRNVDIPGAFAAYNRYHAESKAGAKKDYIKCTLFRKNPTAAGNCIGCGKCEKHCPQGLPIRNHLKDAQKELEIPIYKVARKLVTWFTHF